jgi:hypothetical protein
LVLPNRFWKSQRSFFHCHRTLLAPLYWFYWDRIKEDCYYFMDRHRPPSHGLQNVPRRSQSGSNNVRSLPRDFLTRALSAQIAVSPIQHNRKSNQTAVQTILFYLQHNCFNILLFGSHSNLWTKS